MSASWRTTSVPFRRGDPGGVADERDRDEDRPEHRHLHLGGRSAALDEVRQDRGEEHDDLRVGDSDDESVAQQFGRTQRPRRAAEHDTGGGPSLADHPDAEIHEVGGADEFHRVVHRRRPLDDRPEADRHQQRLCIGATCVSEHGEHGGPAAVGDGAAHDEQHTRPRDDDDRERAGGECQEGRGRWHRLRLRSDESGDRTGSVVHIGEAGRERRAPEADHVGLTEVGDDAMVGGESAGDRRGPRMPHGEMPAATRRIARAGAVEPERLAAADPEAVSARALAAMAAIPASAVSSMPDLAAAARGSTECRSAAGRCPVAGRSRGPWRTGRPG